MTSEETLMSNIYSRLQGDVKQFREPEFVGYVMLRIENEQGDGYVAVIKCPRNVGLAVRPIKQVHEFCCEGYV